MANRIKTPEMASKNGGIVRVAERQASQTSSEMIKVHNGAIGRGQAGKTALFRALAETPVGEYFPSGLYLDTADPKQAARAIREAERTRRLLSDSGLPPTVEQSTAEYFLYSADDQRVCYQIREVIGQVLTHTVPDSDEEQQARYEAYMRHLLDTHVIWTVIPTPPANPTGRDARRYSNDLRITNAYLKEVLRLRQSNDRCSVALVLSKVDSLFANEEDAREYLTPEVLHSSLNPLVNTVLVSEKVSDAAIFPVSAFGFGNAVLRENADPSQKAEHEASADADSNPFPDDPVWLLRDSSAQDPFNLTGLVLWSLLFGLANQEVYLPGRDDEPPTTEICRQLMDDFSSVSKWVLPVKGRLSNGAEA